MSVDDSLPASTDAEFPSVPSTTNAKRAKDESGQTVVYDRQNHNAWIQGNTVNPENL